ncbi:hypothetical protein [Oleomonas cavernae]|nr:hypothetical protein [Oleomonas cavernae]
MTDDTIALRTPLEGGSGVNFMRDMIGFAAERLIVNWRPGMTPYRWWY